MRLVQSPWRLLLSARFFVGFPEIASPVYARFQVGFGATAGADGSCTNAGRISARRFSETCTVPSRFSGGAIPPQFSPTAPKPPGQSSSAAKGLFSRTASQSKGPLPVPSGWHPAKAAKHLPGWTPYRRPAIFPTPVLSMAAWTNPGHTAVHRSFSKITGACPLCPADGNFFESPILRQRSGHPPLLTGL